MARDLALLGSGRNSVCWVMCSRGCSSASGFMGRWGTGFFFFGGVRGVQGGGHAPPSHCQRVSPHYHLHQHVHPYRVGPTGLPFQVGRGDQRLRIHGPRQRLGRSERTAVLGAACTDGAVGVSTTVVVEEVSGSQQGVVRRMHVSTIQ